MAAMTTARLMEIALEMAGWEDIPGDCAIYYPGMRISHVLLGIDVGTSELFMARQLGYHAVLAHHPAGYAGPFWEVYRLHVGQMVTAGVPRDVAEAAVAERIAELRGGVSARELRPRRLGRAPARNTFPQHPLAAG